MADYLDLLIVDNDLAIDGNVESPVSERASIAQDIQHMIRETGLLVEMVGQRNAEAVQQRMNRIEQHVENDQRIVPGTARVTRVDTETFYISAKTVKYGHLEVYL